MLGGDRAVMDIQLQLFSDVVLHRVGSPTREVLCSLSNAMEEDWKVDRKVAQGEKVTFGPLTLKGPASIHISLVFSTLGRRAPPQIVLHATGVSPEKKEKGNVVGRKVKVFFYWEREEPIKFGEQQEMSVMLDMAEVDIDDIEAEMDRIELTHQGFQRWAGSKSSQISQIQGARRTKQ